MAVKAILIFCASALFVQTVFSQCLGRGITGPLGAGWPYDGLAPFDGYGGAWPAAGCGAGFGPLASAAALVPPTGLAAAYGGGLSVTSVSPIAPTGLTVTSENAIEGALAVVGQLPFLGAIATDGVFPTAGAGVVSYGCGDGAIGITAEGPIAPAAAPALGYGAGLAPFGYGSGVAGYKGIAPFGGCGCGALF